MVGHALQAARFLFCFGERWQKHCRQNDNDRNDDEQFYQRESRRRTSVAKTFPSEVLDRYRMLAGSHFNARMLYTILDISKQTGE